MGTNSKVKKRSPQQKQSKMGVPESDKRKKIWSFDSLREAMQPSSEELEYREEKMREPDFVEKYSKLFKCTKCQSNFKPIVVNHEKVPVHPCLGVLMCQECCDYYEDGEFSLDSDGEDKYCRWCGEGGTIFGCSKCICGFCATCIKQHFNAQYFKQVQKDEDWLCFFCNPKPLWDLRFICSLAIKMSESNISDSKENKEDVTYCPDASSDNTYFEEDQETEVTSSKRREQFKTKRKKLTTTKKGNKETKHPAGSTEEVKNLSSQKSEKSQKFLIYTSSSEESDSEIPRKQAKYTSTPLQTLQMKAETELFEKKKSNVLRELKKILTLSEHQMSSGVTWSRKTLEKMATPDYITNSSELVKECQKVKQFLSLLSTFLVQFCNSVDSVEKTLSKNDVKIVQHDSTAKDQSPYLNILQFLGFVRGQVKAFMEKGISLSDIFEAEVYDDDKIIGIKKKSNCSFGTSSQGKSKPSVSNSSSSSISNFKINCSIDNQENSEPNKIDELDKIRDDDILDLVANQTLQRDFDIDDDLDESTTNATVGNLNKGKSQSDAKDDIQDIIAILENA